MGNSQSNEDHQHPQQQREQHNARSNGRVSQQRESKTLPHATSLEKSSTLPTTTSPVTLTSRPRSSTNSSSSKSASATATSPLPTMGQSESRQHSSSRPSALPTNAIPFTDGAEHSPSSQPKHVPTPSQHTPAPIVQSPYAIPQSNYTRPPRLPLPIEEEIHTPGSPIITPHDLSSPLDVNGVDGVIPRRTSVLSATTADDDEVGEDPAFALDSDPLAPTVPTTVEWNGGGEKVFVTGTFVNWERKFKMHKNEGRDGVYAILQLKPGTHHIKFLVDGNMVTADHLPTTVDWTNILVNYLEVVAPLPESAETQSSAPAVPMPIPGAAMTAGQAEGAGRATARPLDMRTTGTLSETDSDLRSTLPSPSQTKQSSVSELPKDQQVTDHGSPPAATRQRLPRPKYTNQFPDFLHDLDRHNDPTDERCQRAMGASLLLPQPPSLPMFMSKSILNGATPHKDDASVLIMPNHTVLNHLATSSIKSGVLATSGTTRYKRKFLTTIMYKPTSDDG